MGRFHLVEGTPIRFLALEWREDWEFDHPTVLLEPARRYSPGGDPPDSMIEDAAIDLLLDGSISDSPNDREFSWRGWSWDRLRAVAAQCLKGKQYSRKGYRALEIWFIFRRHENGDLIFEETSRPSEPPRSARNT